MCDMIVFMHCIPANTKPQSCVKSWLCLISIQFIHMPSRISWLLFTTIDHQVHLRASPGVYFPHRFLAAGKHLHQEIHVQIVQIQKGGSGSTFYLTACLCFLGNGTLEGFFHWSKPSQPRSLVPSKEGGGPVNKPQSGGDTIPTVNPIPSHPIPSHIAVVAQKVKVQC